MKKKCEVSTSTIIGWAIGIFALFAIIFIVIGPQQLLAKSVWAAKSFGLGKLPEESTPEFPGSDTTPPEVLGYFNRLVALIRANPGEQRCLIHLDETPKSENNYFVALSSGTSSGGTISIRKKNEQGEYGLTSANIETISGFGPCIVAGSDGAENFYNNWLGTSIPQTPATPEYFNNVPANQLIILEPNKIITPNEGNGRGYDLPNDNAKFYLYKADLNHFCFMPVWDDWWSDCDRPIGDNLQKGLDADCFGTIRYRVLECNDMERWRQILINYEANKCNVNPSTCEITGNLNCQCFSAGQYDGHQSPGVCNLENPYCYNQQYGCYNDINPTVCKQSLGSAYVQPPQCTVTDNACQVTNAPCSCHTAGSQSGYGLPETCLTGQYCYNGGYGCEDNTDTQYCKETNPNFVLPSPCTIDSTTCGVTNAPCSCHTAGSMADSTKPDTDPNKRWPETCVTGQYCYNGDYGCETIDYRSRCNPP